jgi:L-alanine-DL-glutamate epimerase-like enolase superfamily enzyme
MPVVDLVAHHVRMPLRAPFVTARRRAEAVVAVLVELRDEHGHSGWREGVQTWRVTGESLAGITAAVTGPLRETVLGRDPEDLETHCRDIARAVVGNTAAKTAVDTALHDLAARRLGVPLTHFLGATTARLATDVTLALADTDQMTEVAAARVGEGFPTLKIKVGDSGNDEVERLRRIRNTAGPEVRLRLDANQAWTPKQAVRILHGIEDADLDVELIEQPVAAGDLAGLAWVIDRIGIPILADESVGSPADLLELVRHHAADMVNIKLAKCGGLRPARHLAAIAEAPGIGVLIGSMLETHVGVGAAAALAAAIPAHGGIADLDAAWWLANPPVTGGTTYNGHTIVLPDTPGLGITGLTPAAASATA